MTAAIAPATTTVILDIDGIVGTSNSLSFPDDLTMSEYESAVATIRAYKDRDEWWEGDAIKEGMRLHPETFSQAWPDHSIDSIRQRYRVSDLIPEELRHPALPWYWYREIPTFINKQRTTTEQIAKLVQSATLAPFWDYRRWHEEVAALKGTTNRGRPSRDIDGAIAFARRKEGEVWTDEDTELVTGLLRP